MLKTSLLLLLVAVVALCRAQLVRDPQLLAKEPTDTKVLNPPYFNIATGELRIKFEVFSR